MALDERRAWFIVDPWHIRPTPAPDALEGFFRRTLGLMSRSDPNGQGKLARFLEWLAFGRKGQATEVDRRGRAPGTTSKRLFTTGPNERDPTDVKEVWFVGCHSGKRTVFRCQVLHSISPMTT